MRPADEDADDVQDARLRRALAHAPDHTAVPDWRLRKAILKEAHEAVGVAELAPRDVSSSPPRWRRILFGSGQGSRMPWNAAFATVLVATLVTVLWQREPVPGARLDADVPSTAPSPPPAPTTVPAPAPEGGAPAQAAAPELQAAPPAPAIPDAPASLGDAPAAAAPPQAPAPSPPSESATQPAPEPPPPPLVFQRAPEAPPAEAPRRSERRRADDSTSAAPRASERFEAEKTEKTEKKAAPATPAASVAPVAPAPPPASIGSATADASSGLGASSSAANAARAARPVAAPSERTAATDPPTFAALSQWNRVTITQRGGGGKSLTRAEAGDLNALLGSAAISAVGAKPLAGAPEWRVTLERDGQTLAVFDVGRNQVRWREGTAPPATGAPSAPALAALGEALRNAVQPPPEPDAAAEPPRNP